MKRLRVRVADHAPPLAVFALVLVAWHAASVLLLDEDRRFLLPPPAQVVRVGLLDPANLEEQLVALAATTRVALTGLAVAIAIGVSFAIVMHQARWIERSFYPYAVVLQTIPILALVPLIGFWFGFDFGSRVLVCVLIAIFPIVTNTLFGLKSIDPSHHDLFTLHRASRWTRLWKLELPGALPAIFTGLRISAGLSVIGAIVGEYFFKQGFTGIGRLLDNYRARLQTEQLFTAVFFSSLLGLCVFWLFGILGRVALGKWHDVDRTPPS